MQYALTASVLLGLASAQATHPAPYESAQKFGLVARITKQASSGTPLNVEGYRLTSGHIGAGEDASLLIPTSGAYSLKPDSYYANGTAEQLAYQDGSVVRTPSGQYQYSVTVTGQDVSVDIGSGSFGVAIRGVSPTGATQHSQPFLGYRPIGAASGFSQFYTCEGQFYQDRAPFLFWRNETTETPAECAEVKLLPQCEGDVQNATQFTQQVPCYEDAASVELLA